MFVILNPVIRMKNPFKSSLLLPGFKSETLLVSILHTKYFIPNTATVESFP